MKVWEEYTDAPAVSVLSGNLLTLLVLFVGWAGYNDEIYIVLHASIVSALFVYISIFVSYTVFRISYSTMPRHFTNPLGYYSAGMGAFIFLLSLASTLALVRGHAASGVVCGVLLFILIAYYYFIAHKTQTYSKEEQNLLLKLYVIKGQSQCDRIAKVQGRFVFVFHLYSRSIFTCIHYPFVLVADTNNFIVYLMDHLQGMPKSDHIKGLDSGRGPPTLNAAGD